MAKVVLLTLIGLLTLATVLTAAIVQAADPSSTLTSSYDYKIEIEVTNSTGAELTDTWIAAEINARQLIDDGFLQADADDVLALDPGNNALQLITQNLDRPISGSTTPAFWWFRLSSLPDGAVYNYSLHLGDNLGNITHDYGFGLGGGSENINVADTSSLDITTNLTMEATNVNLVSLSTTEQFIIQKSDAYELGVTSSSIFARIFSNASTTAITRPDSSVSEGWQEEIGCAAGSHWQCINEVVADDGIVVRALAATTVEDIYGLTNLGLSEGTAISSVSLTFRFRSFGSNSRFISGDLCFNACAQRTAGTEQAVPLSSYNNFTETLGRPGGGDWTGSDIDNLQVAIESRSVGGTDRTNLSQAYTTITYTPEEELTTTVVTGTEQDILATYDGTIFSLSVNGTEQASSTPSITLSSTTNALTIGTGGLEGTIDRIRVGDTSTSTPTYRLDLDFEPDNITQTQEGTSTNSWNWLGTITDQSGSGNDGSYTLIRDMTNITVSVNSPIIKTPPTVPTLEVTLANVLGGFDTNLGASVEALLEDPQTGVVLFPFVPILDVAATQSGISAEALRLLVFGTIALILGALTARATKMDWVGYLTAGAIVLLGGVGNLYAMWIVFTYGVAVLGIFAFKRLTGTGGL